MIDFDLQRLPTNPKGSVEMNQLFDILVREPNPTEIDM